MTPRADSAALVLVALLVGCGGSVAPGMVVAAQCTSATGLTLQLESGTVADCQWSAAMADGYRARYEARWGPAADGWTIRVRDSASFAGDHSGYTWMDSRIIDLQTSMWRELPHELRHAAGHQGHDGWCAEFEPWEESELGFNERAYLGCSAN